MNSNPVAAESSTAYSSPDRDQVPCWPLRGRCTRIEQRLILALRLLDDQVTDREQATRILESMGLTSAGILAFAQLSMLLGTKSDFRLLRAESSFVSSHELGLLISLRRFAGPLPRRAVIATGRQTDKGIDPMWDALRQCGAALRTASVRLSPRTIALPGRRALEDEATALPERPNRRFRTVAVRKVEQITPHLQRITMGGPELADFRIDQAAQWVKVFFPVQGDQEPLGRAYTVRRHRPALAEIDLDFVLHETGPLSDWARNAKVGDVMQLAGPRGGFAIHPESQWALLVGDETALPAIGTLLETLPPDTQASVFIEVDDAADMQALPQNTGAHLHWVVRSASTDNPSELLLGMIRQAEIPEGAGQVWMAGEASLARSFRQHLTFDRRIPRERIHCIGYWKRGAQDHKDLAAG